MREAIILHVDEEQVLVSRQLSVLISKVARADWPTLWPDLFGVLVGGLTGDRTREGLRQTLFTLYCVLKELASKRLVLDKRRFRAMAAELLPVVHAIQNDHAQAFLSACEELSHASGNDGGGGNGGIGGAGSSGAGAGVSSEEIERRCEEIMPVAEILKLCLKCSRCLVLKGTFSTKIGQMGPDHIGGKAILGLLPLMQNLVACRQALAGAAHGALGTIGDALEACVKTSVRTVVEAHEMAPEEFMPLVPSFLAAFFDVAMQCDAPTGDEPVLEPFYINCMLFLSNVINTKADAAPPECQLSEDQLTSLCERLILRDLPLQEAEFDEWTEDPEAFLLREESITRREHRRPCAEHVLLFALEKHTALVVPVLVGLLQRVEETALASGAAAGEALLDQALLQREAVYLAVGLGAYNLHGALEFSSWFTEHLAPFLSEDVGGGVGGVGGGGAGDTGALARLVLRRRIVWLISCWRAEIPTELLPPLYDVLVSLIVTRGNGVMVRLAAVATLHSLVDDWDFDADVFVVNDRVAQLVPALYDMLGVVSELDTALKVISLLSLVVERIGPRVQSSLDAVVGPLPALWSCNSDNGLMQARILGVLRLLVAGVGEESVALMEIVVPAVETAVDVARPENLYLVEEGTHLWLEFMQQLPSGVYSDELHALFSHLPLVLETHLDLVKPGMGLVEAYALIGNNGQDGAPPVLASLAEPVAQAAVCVVGNVVAAGAAMAIKAVETCLQCCPNDAPAWLSASLLKMLLSCLESAEEEAVDADGRRVGPQREDDVVIVGYLAVLARVLFQTPEAFLALVAECVGAAGGDDERHRCILAVVDIFVDNFDAAGYSSAGPWRRKCWALALCTPLGGGMLDADRIEAVVNVCVSVLAEEERRKGDGGSAGDFIPTDCDDESSGVYQRRQRLFLEDSVYCADLREVLTNSMGSLAGGIGQASFDQIMSQMDPSTLQQLEGGFSQ